MHSNSPNLHGSIIPREPILQLFTPTLASKDHSFIVDGLSIGPNTHIKRVLTEIDVLHCARQRTQNNLPTEFVILQKEPPQRLWQSFEANTARKRIILRRKYFHRIRQLFQAETPREAVQMEIQIPHLRRERTELDRPFERVVAQIQVSQRLRQRGEADGPREAIVAEVEVHQPWRQLLQVKRPAEAIPRETKHSHRLRQPLYVNRAPLLRGGSRVCPPVDGQHLPVMIAFDAWPILNVVERRVLIEKLFLSGEAVDENLHERLLGQRVVGEAAERAIVSAGYSEKHKHERS